MESSCPSRYFSIVPSTFSLLVPIDIPLNCWSQLSQIFMTVFLGLSNWFFKVLWSLSKYFLLSHKLWVYACKFIRSVSINYILFPYLPVFIFLTKLKLCWMIKTSCPSFTHTLTPPAPNWNKSQHTFDLNV